MNSKSTVAQIRWRFDNDVERFSSLETGQTSTVDAAITLGLITRAAAETTPGARRVLDIGCGAGNYTLQLLQVLPDLDVMLVDLSQPMLDRAAQRVGEVAGGAIVAAQADIRELALEEAGFDVILAAAVVHHLRDDGEWRDVFAKCYRALRPGGSLWISDLIEHSTPGIQALMWARYGDYLTALRDEAYRDHVIAYVEQEDTPRSLLFQIDLLREVGFETIEILHKNGCFAAFGAAK